MPPRPDRATPDRHMRDEAFVVHFTVQINEQEPDSRAHEVMQTFDRAINEQGRSLIRSAWHDADRDFGFQYRGRTFYTDEGTVEEVLWFLRRLRYRLGERLAAAIRAS